METNRTRKNDLERQTPGQDGSGPHVLDTAGTITSDRDTITVTLSRRTYSPVLRQSDLRADTTIPWWPSRLRFQFS